MSELVDIYIDGVRKVHGNYFAQWLPTTLLNVGDVGILEKSRFLGKRHLFKKITSLEALDISFEIEPDPESSSLKLSSGSDVKRSIKLSGNTSVRFPQVPIEEFAVGYDFEKKGGFAVEIPECYEPSIKDLRKLGIDLLNAYEREDDFKWEKNWFVITRVVQASSVCILISQQKDSKIDFSTKAKVEVSNLSLGDASLEFQNAGEQGSVYEIRGAMNVTPYFQLAGLKKKPFRDPAFKPSWKDAVDLSPSPKPPGFTYEDTPDDDDSDAFFLDVVTYND
jgi:hypothetical protein